MSDEDLLTLNESELLWLARLQGLPVLRRGMDKTVLVQLVTGSAWVAPEHLAPTNFTRGKLEDFIATNIDKVRGQLPGCNGRCCSFMCTEGKHMSCFLPNEPLLL